MSPNSRHWPKELAKIITFKKNIGTAAYDSDAIVKMEFSPNCGMGTQNNQNFVQIPHARFIDILAYKARARGIAFITVEESYTSKCSFIDGEDMCHHDRYLGRRIMHGLFRSKEGILINADLNGALNIIRKAVPNAFAEGIEAVVVPPTRTLVA